MNRLFIIMLLCMSAVAASAQGLIKGKVLDRLTSEPLGFVAVKVVRQGTDALVQGAVSDEEGNFQITDIPNGNYTLQLSFVGYKPHERNFQISDRHRSHNLQTIYLAEEARQLKEVTVTGQRSSMKLEVDRKSFDVSQLVTNAGQTASEALENIPSVEVDNDGNVSLRGNSSVDGSLASHQKEL